MLALLPAVDDRDMMPAATLAKTEGGVVVPISSDRRSRWFLTSRRYTRSLRWRVCSPQNQKPATQKRDFFCWDLGGYVAIIERAKGMIPWDGCIDVACRPRDAGGLLSGPVSNPE